MPALVYLDTGEIFEADPDGDPTEVLVATMEAGVLDDDVHALGQVFAAAPALLEAAVAAQEGMRQLLRNHIASMPDEASHAEELLEAAIAAARGER